MRDELVQFSASSLVALFIAVAAASPYASQAAAPDPVAVTSAAQLLDESLTFLSEKSSDKDTQFYKNGVWHLVNQDKAWACMGGPGSAAAVLWKWRERNPAPTTDALSATAAKARQEWLHRIAVETFNTSIKDLTTSSGSLLNMNTVELIFFSRELANTLLVLGDTLDAATRQRWLVALNTHVTFMIKNGDLPNPDLKGWKATDGWTTNGNVELCECELVYMMWQITGDKKYKDLFETQWKHTLIPDPQRWKGYGLFYIKAPTKEDGSDGAAYVAEAEQEPGFDREYTQFQLTIASRLYVRSRDPRVLRLVNLLLNAELPHVDQKTWILDATYGSRHSLHLPFYSCGLAVAAYLGDRPDLIPKLAGQWEKGVKPFYINNAKLNYGNPGIYRAYGCDATVLLQASP